jgi:hypothetical protein
MTKRELVALACTVASRIRRVNRWWGQQFDRIVRSLAAGRRARAFAIYRAFPKAGMGALTDLMLDPETYWLLLPSLVAELTPARERDHVQTALVTPTKARTRAQRSAVTALVRRAKRK